VPSDQDGFADLPDVVLHRRLLLLGKVLQVSAILCAALRLLHLPQAVKGADAHPDAENVALDRILDELRIPRHTSGELNDVEAPELGVGGHVSAPPHDSGVSIEVEAPVSGRGQRRLESPERPYEPVQVPRIWVGDQVEIRRGADV
jgi:hypothetical protein